MPDVRNCRRCGKIFSYFSGPPICPVCKQLDETDFKRVKEYLYQNPGATLQQVSSELEISVDKIKRFLKEGRLEIVGEDANLFLECESCGKAIKTGRFCDECEKNLTRDLSAVAGQISQSLSKEDASKKGSELRYLHKDEGRNLKK